MNKKYLIFGIFGLFAIALVSAALVDYLSNETDVVMTTKSPLTLEVSNDDLGLIYGGAEFETTLTVTNNIEFTVEGMLTTIITNSLANADCDDFQSIEITVIGGSDDGTVLDVLALCADATIEIPVLYLGDESQSYNVTGQFEQNVVPASYQFNSQVLVGP